MLASADLSPMRSLWSLLGSRAGRENIEQDLNGPTARIVGECVWRMLSVNDPARSSSCYRCNQDTMFLSFQKGRL